MAENTQLVSSLGALSEDLNATVDELFTLAQAGSWTRAQALRHTELASLQRRFSENLVTFQENVRLDADRSLARSGDLRDVTLRGWIGISLVAVVIGIIATVLTGRGIIGQINRLVVSARAIQQGDLSQRARFAGHRTERHGRVVQRHDPTVGRLHPDPGAKRHRPGAVQPGTRQAD
ncbi:MAG: hypothetical protein IPK19_21970 [Chloroflexi bacterium]|nr:hypothetical protein [Chloroflexota bacterium]